MEAAGDKIRSNSQGWEDVRVIGERQVLMVGATLPSARAGAGEVREHRPRRPTRGGLRARRLRMRDAATGSEGATGDASTPLEERVFGEPGSSFEAHARFRQSATARQRNWRRNKRMGLGVRPVRLSRKQAQKLVELGYL